MALQYMLVALAALYALANASSPPSPNAAAASCTPLTQTNPTASNYWYANITHNGKSPFINNANYTVFRSVTVYGADPSGKNDSSPQIQAAIDDAYALGQTRQGDPLNTTGQPAVVYFPPGTYKLQSPIRLTLSTVLIGNPISMPILKASSTWGSSNLTMIIGRDPAFIAVNNFYITIKNLQLDSTAVNKDQALTLLDWSVSQATQLTNLIFNMPVGSTGHVGIAAPTGGSPTEIGDLTFQGGSIGLSYPTFLQQGHFKSLTFVNCITAIKLKSCFSCVFTNTKFTNNTVGIDMTGNQIGSIVLIDPTAVNVGTVVKTTAEKGGNHTLVIENYTGTNVTAAVSASGTTVLNNNVANTWVYGNTFTAGGPTSGSHQNGTVYTTTRPSVLLQGNQYATVPPPTYKGYSASQVQNVKSVAGLPVFGDGVTDDTANLNQIIANAANCKILYFPAGTYLVSSTIFFPQGSRVVGEVWSAISATGSFFADASAPNVMVQVGNPGDSGVAQFTDMLFTVADVLPGCILLEVNIAGTAPGTVGFWNTHFRVGGARGSQIATKCAVRGDPSACKAAFLLAHLTASSSAYIENMWGWTADHSLDAGSVTDQFSIATGRGMLIEATGGTWLQGTAFEHNTLYQFNLNKAQNVYVGMHQSETPYWQGPGTSTTTAAPAPWTPVTTLGDPSFSNCNGNDPQCAMAWSFRISGSSNVFIYGSAYWNFFNQFSETCKTSFCQTNAAQILSTTGLNWFGINTHTMVNAVTNNGVALVTAANSPGGWGSCTGAMLVDM